MTAQATSVNRVTCGAREANMALANQTVAEIRSGLTGDLQIPSGAKARVGGRVVGENYRVGLGEQVEFEQIAGVFG